jgi:photosystem II stability/assembly factor-like uncharacterized protein
MKKIVLLFVFLLSVISMSTHAQAVKFSKVKINLDSDPTVLMRLATLGVGIDHGQLREGVSFTSDFSSAEVAIMKNNNFSYEVLVDDVAADFKKRNKLAQKRVLNLNTTGCNSKMGKVQNPANFSLGAMGGYYTFNQMKADLDKMAQLYPNLISVKASLSTTIDGNPIYYVRISDNPSVNESEPEVLYTALHHSREPASLSQLMYFMWYLLENYSKDPTVKHIVDNTELYLVPCVNPDGYKYNESTNPSGGGMWRKNRKKIGSTYGVDLNRNYGNNWGYDEQGSSGSVYSEVYRGPNAFSEIETSTLKSFCESHNFLLALNYHTFGNLLIYPWGYKSSAFTPDSTLFDNYAQKLTAENQYLYGIGEKTVGYIANGNSDDWMYGEQGTKNKIISMTPESGAFNDGFWPTQDKIIPICRENLLQNIEAALFAEKYATVEDVSPKIVSSKNTYSQYNVKRFGMANDGVYTVSLAPISNVTSVGDTKTYTGLSILETKLDSIALVLSSTIKDGQAFSYSITISNGSFQITDTIIKYYGAPINLFSDNMSNLTNWTSSGFQVYSGTSSSTPSCVTDSPTGKYASNANASLTLKSAVSLAGVTHATLKFKAKWDIESGMDHFKVQISTNKGASWQSLCGKYAKKGTEIQGNDIIYDGVKSSWVQEDISLDSYIGSSILVRFSLASDGALQRDGVFLDDISIESVSLAKETAKGKEIISFQIPNLSTTSTITSDEVLVVVPNTADLKNLTPTFTLSTGAKAGIQGVVQLSGSTANDFTQSKVYTITAEDGTIKNYLVTFKLLAPSSPTDVLSKKICIGSTIPALTVTGATVKWYSDAGLTNLLTSGNSFTPTQTKAGVYVYYVTQTVNNVESSAAQDTLTIQAIPNSPISGGDQQAFVGGAIPLLSVAEIPGATISWYSDASMTKLLATATSFKALDSTKGIYTYYVSAATGGCQSVATSITLTLNSAPSPWTSISLTPAQTSAFYGVTSLSNATAIAVGATGVLQQFNGTAWSKSTSGTTFTINAVNYYNERNVWAVGNSGNALKYNGSTWVANNTTGTLLCVAVPDTNAVWVGGSSGKLIKFDGKTWSNQTSGVYYDIKGISFASNTAGVFVGTYGTLSLFDGTKWNKQTTTFTNDFYGVHMLNSSTIFAVGASGTIIQYTGSTWTKMTSGVTSTLRGVYFVSPTDGWAVGDGGVILHYDGTKWTKVTSGTTNILYSISLRDADNGFAVGASGTILQYANKVRKVIPPVVSPITICKGEVSPTIKTSGSAIKWYSDITLKTLVGSGNTFTPSTTAVGKYTYYVTDTQNGSESMATAVTLTINDTPSAMTSSGDQEITQGGKLAPFTVSGNEVVWYADSTLSTVLGKGSSFTPAAIVVGKTHYYASQTSLGCKSEAVRVTLIVNPLVKSNDNWMRTFSFIQPPMTASILDTNITVTVPNGTNVTNLVAQFSVASTAKVDVQKYVQASGVTANDFTKPVAYTVTAEDGSKRTYLVKVNVSTSSPASGNDILTFGFMTPWVTASVGGGTITAVVPNTTDLKTLKPVFTLSTLATATINSVVQITGVSVVDFSKPVVYVVKAEDNTTQSFTVIITLEAPAAPEAVSPTPVCADATIPNLTATGSNIAWYTDSTLQNLVYAGSSLATAKTAAGVYTYFATQTNNGIKSLGAKVVLTINQTPAAPLSAGDQTAFAGGYIPVLNVDAVNGTTITWWNGPDESSSATTQIGVGTSFNTGKTAIGTYTFYARASINSCKSPATAVQLTISNGAGWSVEKSLQSNILFGVSTNSNSALAVGATGVVNQYNGAWSVGTSGVISDINAVHFVSPKSAWAVGKSGTTIKYNGKTWSSISNSSSTTLYSVFALDSNMVYAGGAYGSLFKSTDGANWSRVNTGSVEDVRGISFANASEGVIVGTSGSISMFNGTSWKAQSSATFTNDFYGVQMLNSKTAWAVGSEGTIVKYNGTTWSPVTSGTTSTLRSVYFTSPTNGWAVGDSGVVVKYDGTSWSAVSSGTKNTLNSVSFSDENNGWAVGAAGTILRYKNLASKVVPPTVAPITACQGGTIPAFTTTGTAIKWYSDAQLKNTLGSGNTYTPTASNPGTYTYYVTDSVAGSTSIATSVTLTILSLPSAPSTSGNDTIHEGESITPFTATGTDIAWYSDAQLAKQIASGGSFTPVAPVSGLNSYYVTQTILGCKSSSATVTLFVDPKSDKKDILTFSFKALNPLVNAVVGISTISLEVPYGTDLTNLLASFTTSNLATVKIKTVKQVSDITYNNFSNPLIYEVTAENGSTKQYTVTVITATPSTQKELTSFAFNSLNVTGTISGNSVKIDVPYGTDVSKLVASFTISPLATISVNGQNQISAVSENNFTQSLIYSVIAQDGSKKDYTVYVTIATPSAAKDITSFSFPVLNLTGTIKETTISFTVPYGTDISNLVANFTVSNLAQVKIGSIAQTSGKTANNFSQIVNYLVTAQDGSTKNYSVSILVTPPSSVKDITAFSIQSPTIDFVIKDTNITATVPFGTKLNNLVATFNQSSFASVSVGGKVQESTVTMNNFNTVLVYEVTAQDGSKKLYRVLISVTPASIEKEITVFNLLSPAVKGDINGNTITVSVPYGTDVTKLVSTFTLSPFAVVKVNGIPQTNGVTQNDFTNPVSYGVFAQDNSSKVYTVIVLVAPRVKSAAKEILSFSVSSPNTSCVVSTNAITATVPYGTDVKNMIATFVASDSAKVYVNNILQTSGVTKQDFSKPIVYTVIAEDGTTNNYTVTITVAAKVLSTAKDIISFAIQSPAITCSVNGTDIKGILPFGTDVKQLIAVFTSSPLSKVTINGKLQVSSTTVNDFTNLVTYTVTAEDGSYQNYDVTLTVESKSKAKEITEFSFVNPAITATIDQNTITATVPYGTDVMKLVANFTVSNLANVSVNGVAQLSGQTSNDFTNTLSYTVTAEDGSTQVYIVKITIAPSTKSNANEMLSFGFVSPAVKAQISGGNIMLTLPYGSDLTKLMVNFMVSDKATVSVNGIAQVSGTTVNNFSNSLVYVVTAEDGSTKSYSVFVSLAKNSAKAITSYLFTNPTASGVVNGNTISLQVPAGTDVKKLLASFTASPGAIVKVAGVVQQSGLTFNDFTNPVTYTVVAEDGTSVEYQVVVYVLAVQKSSEKEMLSFGITNPYTVGVISGTSISLTVPYGTDIKTLTAIFTVSPKANTYIGSAGQITGVSINNFSFPVSYTITAEDGTTKTYIVTVTVDKNPLSLDAINMQQVAVYPNPTKGQFYVQSNEGSLLISVTDLQGRIIYSLENNSYTGNKLPIDLSNFEAAVYMVHITQNGVSSMHKLELIK